MKRHFVFGLWSVMYLLCAGPTLAGTTTVFGTEFKSRHHLGHQSLYMYVESAPDIGFGLAGLAVGDDNFAKVYIGPVAKLLDVAEAAVSIGYGNEGQRPSALYAFVVRTYVPIGGHTVSTNYLVEHSTTIWRRGELSANITDSINLGVVTQSDTGTGPRLGLMLPWKIRVWDAAMNRRNVWTNVASLSITF